MKMKAFTMVEMLLYIGLVSIFIGTLASFLGAFNQASLKASTIEEVNQQGLYLSEVIGQAVRDGSTISAPTAGNSATALTLATTKQPARNPIILQLTSGKLYISEAGGANVQLSSDRVTVSNLSFSNTSQLSTNGNVKFQFTLNYVNATGRSEFNYQQTFYGSATTR
jgi:hypothetical protein